MAIVKMSLPKCDVCGEIWLPDKASEFKGTSARQDARAFDKALRSEGRSLRCGKCKSPRWDSEFRSGRKEEEGKQVSTVSHRKLPSSAVHKIQNGVGLEDLYGIFEDEFKALGGGEAFLKAERAAWGPDPWDKVALAEKSHSEHDQ